MKKSIRFFTWLVFATFSAYAQPKAKKVVAIMPFLSSIPENRQAAAELQSIAIQTFHAKTNIVVVDRSADELVVKELNNQIREESISSHTLVEQGKLSGSQELIVGTLNSISIEPRDGKYLASINFTLQVDDASTGTMISSKSFRGNTSKTDVASGTLSRLSRLGNSTIFKQAGDLGSVSSVLMADTKEAAVHNAIDDTRKQMADWINEVYPPDIRILSVDGRTSKGLPETIMIAGFTTGISTGKNIIVNEVTYIDDGAGGKLKRVKKIAELKVTEVQGEVTICKLKNGEEVLDEKMKNNAKLEFILK